AAASDAPWPGPCGSARTRAAAHRSAGTAGCRATAPPRHPARAAMARDAPATPCADGADSSGAPAVLRGPTGVAPDVGPRPAPPDRRPAVAGARSTAHCAARATPAPTTNRLAAVPAWILPAACPAP